MKIDLINGKLVLTPEYDGERKDLEKLAAQIEKHSYASVQFREEKRPETAFILHAWND